MKPTKLLTVALLFVSSSLFSISCGNEGEKKDEKSGSVEETTKDQPETHGNEVKPDEVVFLQKRLFYTFFLVCYDCFCHLVAAG